MLTSSLSFVNKSLMISIFCFPTAEYRALLLNNNKISFRNIIFDSVKKYYILNPIGKFNFKCHYNIWQLNFINFHILKYIFYLYQFFHHSLKT